MVKTEKKTTKKINRNILSSRLLFHSYIDKDYTNLIAVSTPQSSLEEYPTGYIFFSFPPNLTKSQAHYKFLNLGNLGGGAVQIIQGLGLSQFMGGEKKKTPCIKELFGFFWIFSDFLNFCIVYQTQGFPCFSIHP